MRLVRVTSLNSYNESKDIVINPWRVTVIEPLDAERTAITFNEVRWPITVLGAYEDVLAKIAGPRGEIL